MYASKEHNICGSYNFKTYVTVKLLTDSLSLPRIYWLQRLDQLELCLHPGRGVKAVINVQEDCIRLFTWSEPAVIGRTWAF